MHFFQSDFFSSILAVRFTHISVCSSSLLLFIVVWYSILYVYWHFFMLMLINISNYIFIFYNFQTLTASY